MPVPRRDKETPNLIVSPSKGLFHCMACGAAGNAIQFVQKHDGVSFRHAFELSDKGEKAAYLARPRVQQASVPVLPCPLEAGAEDAALLGQLAALEYLASRGLDDPGVIERYWLGFADRSLGLRMPESNRKEGEALRSRLTRLGVWRESGHEHFNGCIVVPLHDASGNIVSFYGRRIGKGTISHLYPPGPHRGLFNRQCLVSSAAFAREEIILCEAVFDALTFCAAGITNVTTLYGTEGFSDELAEALRLVRRVKLAYDADEAGERAAARDAERLRALGVEVWRIKFPWGMDANEYARKVTPAGKSLALLMNAAVWCGKGVAPAVAEPSQDSKTKPAASVAPASLSLAACVSSSEKETAKEEAVASAQAHETKAPGPPAPVMEQRGEAWFLTLDGREYRVMGLEKTLGADHLKIGLRVRVGERFHLDQVDLMRDAERRRFVERAAEETASPPSCLSATWDACSWPWKPSRPG